MWFIIPVIVLFISKTIFFDLRSKRNVERIYKMKTPNTFVIYFHLLYSKGILIDHAKLGYTCFQSLGSIRFTFSTTFSNKCWSFESSINQTILKKKRITNKHIRMISDTKDWRNGCWKCSFVITGIFIKYITIKTFILHNIYVFTVFLIK